MRYRVDCVQPCQAVGDIDFYDPRKHVQPIVGNDVQLGAHLQIAGTCNEIPRLRNGEHWRYPTADPCSFGDRGQRAWLVRSRILGCEPSCWQLRCRRDHPQHGHRKPDTNDGRGEHDSSDDRAPEAIAHRRFDIIGKFTRVTPLAIVGRKWGVEKISRPLFATFVVVRHLPKDS